MLLKNEYSHSISLIILLFFPNICLGNPPPDPLSPNTEYVNKLEYQDLKEKNSNIAQELIAINKIKEKFQEEISKIEKQNLKEAEIDILIKKGKNTLENIKTNLSSAPPKTDLIFSANTSKAFDDFSKSLRKKLFASFYAIKQFKEDIIDQEIIPLLSNRNVELILYSAIRSITKATEFENRRELDGTNELKELILLNRSITRDEIVQKTNLNSFREKVMEAERNLGEIEKEAPQIFKDNKRKVMSLLEEGLKSLSNTENSRNQEFSENQSRLQLLEDSFKEEKERQEVLDQKLAFAIWFMIGALVILFISLRAFSDELTKAIIENRTLVEVVSMAFMLLTIIILGTGKKIGTETLGTLLGTIAGYIFGRRTGNTQGPNS